MNYGISMSISLILFCFLFLIIQKCNKKNESKMTRDDFVVRYPKALSIISVSCSLFFLIIIVLISTVLYNEENSLLSYIAFFIFCLIFILLGLIAFYATIKERVIVKGNNITYYPAFLKKRVFTFKEISSVKWDTHGVICYKNNKKIMAVFSGMEGYDFLVSRLNARRTNQQ